MIIAIVIAVSAVYIAGVVLYAHRKHLSAIAEVKGIVETMRSHMYVQSRELPASPEAPKVEQP